MHQSLKNSGNIFLYIIQVNLCLKSFEFDSRTKLRDEINRKVNFSNSLTLSLASSPIQPSDPGRPSLPLQPVARLVSPPRRCRSHRRVPVCNAMLAPRAACTHAPLLPPQNAHTPRSIRCQFMIISLLRSCPS
jgi:hypothetical protein